ncbi:Cytidine deaminase-like protein [Pseudocohnilembus persalinus]|uniref:Cytidine deaminase-like protein n=1 Tax=Pseudocohnilembus persalinus TaxID=266149 RepID=A0A0V0QCP7_PSEPJ|nr:Cytidine deaminase-like protein [Pseudocohnilembus persalinus]|eukprot:KRW99989.1 Cytidine deaminase-like protein [Pseudocohnilembus persalinus]
MSEQKQRTQDEWHQYFIEESIKESAKGIETGEGDPFGAVIVKDNKIIARGYNQIVLLNDSTAHGEMQAIRNAGQILNSWKLNDCILYASCEPCSMCHSAIILTGIKKVYFAMSAGDLQTIVPHCTEGYAQSEINKAREERNTPFFQILEKREEAMKSYREGKQSTNQN